ncbi:DUF2182 domain-containing protein [Albimonas sp. CAU 1670]|uniref:DUF2182 domain-containing protein n=1 Tax=Albimonas sp. CAU 1670 TaxID=3032599 RepID=UPI0023DB1380|nr:DUF2182 domain-containing protein [Albimonas sp. CAU 1670]MDF2235297.1 DUF2182 domain-containing protein [Albimonas sp. CAU 1670]
MGGVGTGAAAGRSARPLRLLPLLAAPALVAAGAWAWLALMIGDMSRIPGFSPMAMMAPQPVSGAMLWGLFVMWAVMMAAMMLPTAAPMLVAFARMQGAGKAGSWAPVAGFAGGYLAVWSGFSLGAALLQAALTDLALMSPMMMTAAAPVSGAILIAAGLYQFTPFKHACLRLCRSPMSFLMTRWREGVGGALRMGLSHGAWCLGCCWALMLALFAVGVMNTAWIVGIAAYVLLEKLVPRSLLLSRLSGAGLLGAGLWLVAGAAMG